MHLAQEPHPLLGASNSHIGPVTWRFYRLVYFEIHFRAIIPVKRSSVLELIPSIKKAKRTKKVKNTIFRSAGFAYWFVGLIRFAQSAPNRS